MSSDIVNINMGEMAVAGEGTVLKTGGIGSCVVVAIYDKEAKIGGMAHAMLPTRGASKNDSDENAERVKDRINTSTEDKNNTPDGLAKYVDESISGLVKEIEKKGGNRARLKAKLVGGSRMFKVLSGDKHGIGYRNIEVAHEYLRKIGIPIESEATGGTVGRIAEFDLANGLVDVSTKM